MSKKVKAIIHDWDDTITNSFETYSGLGKVNMQAVKDAWGDTVPDIICAGWKGINLEQAEKLLEEFTKTDEFEKKDYTPVPFLDVKETLRGLKSKTDFLEAGLRDDLILDSFNKLPQILSDKL